MKRAILLAMLFSVTPLAAQPLDPRTNPRESVQRFLESARDGDFVHAATFLDNRLATEANARDLFSAIELAAPNLLDTMPEPANAKELLLADIEIDGQHHEIRMRQEADGTWRFPRDSIQHASAILREFGGSSFGRNFPGFLSRRQLFGMALWQLLGLVGLWVIGIALGSVIRRAVIRLDKWYMGRSEIEWVKGPLSIMPGPVRIFVALWTVRLFSPYLRLTASQQDSLNLVIRVLLIATVTWFVWRFLTVAGQYLEQFLARDVNDPVKVRSIHTQIRVPQSILRVMVVSIGISVIFVQFEAVRNVGLSLLASAGFAGVIIGLAAQRSISNMLSGLQLAFFQPIKMGDTVEVEGAWGTVEEIGLTTVIIKVWDQRRLILPVSYFLEKPVWNWSKTSIDMLGAIQVMADYATPINEAREVLKQALKDSPLWDGKVASLVVTEVTTEAIELRAVMSAADGRHLWDLRCHVRERMLTWLQSNGYLPIRRVQSIPPRS